MCAYEKWLLPYDRAAPSAPANSVWPLRHSSYIFYPPRARVINLCKRVDYIISQPKDDKPSLKGHGQCHVTHYSIFDARKHISGTADSNVDKSREGGGSVR